MSDLNMVHFEALRAKINVRLEELQTPHRDLQIREFTWLYGALGAVPSDVMFICENPSLAGVRSASIDTIDGRAPDIEAQWWGGRKNSAAKRFRPLLRRMGLKTSHPAARGGWRCYITNVVKEANVAGADQRAKSPAERAEQARAWADVLEWEIDEVSPSHVFCVGDAAHKAVSRLQREGMLPAFMPHLMGHYSARGRDDDVVKRMALPLRTVLGVQ
jgi:hypothetical protein